MANGGRNGHTVRKADPKSRRSRSKAAREAERGPMAEEVPYAFYEEDLNEYEIENLMMPSCVVGSARKRGGVWGRGPGTV